MKNDDQQVDWARCAEMAATCTNFSLRKVSRLVGALYDEELRPSGLRGTQLNLMVALALMRIATVKKLAATLVVDRTTLTRALAPLERDGLIQSEPGKDGRERLLSLTEVGGQRLREATELWERAQSRVAAMLGQVKARDLNESLKAATEALGGD